MAAEYPENTTHDKNCEICKHDEIELLHDDGQSLERDLAKFRVWNKDTLKMEDCPKNGKHEKFITPDRFGLSDLPENFRKQEFLDFIMALEKMTVKIRVKSLSTKRPNDDSTQIRKTEQGDKYSGHIGSGRISACLEFHKSPVGGKHCPCLECMKSQTPKQEWGVLQVQTAKHVVFDSIETFGAEVTVFYNSDQTRDQAQTLSGVSMVIGEDEQDYCLMTVITHDERLYNKLSYMYTLACYEKQFRRFRSFKGKSFAIIISHPHGCYKQITVGEHVEKEFLDGASQWVRHVYTTPTCPASSGAPCYFFGDIFKDTVLPAPHRKSHSCQDKTNSSGPGFFLKRNEFNYSETRLNRTRLSKISA